LWAQLLIVAKLFVLVKLGCGLISDRSPVIHDRTKNPLIKSKFLEGNICRNTETNSDIHRRDEKIHSLNFCHLNVKSKPNFCQYGYGLTRFGGQSHYYYP
jgi:hypothetical protein